jgi:hypothetical protein
MTTLSPKTNFLLYAKPAAEELQKQRESSWLTVSLTYALAQMAHEGHSKEELLGAREFINTLQNLWEPVPKDVKLPAQTLPSFDVPPEQLQKIATQAAKEEKK